MPFGLPGLRCGGYTVHVTVTTGRALLLIYTHDLYCLTSYTHALIYTRLPGLVSRLPVPHAHGLCAFGSRYVTGGCHLHVAVCVRCPSLRVYRTVLTRSHTQVAGFTVYCVAGPHPVTLHDFRAQRALYVLCWFPHRIGIADLFTVAVALPHCLYALRRYRYGYTRLVTVLFCRLPLPAVVCCARFGYHPRVTVPHHTCHTTRSHGFTVYTTVHTFTVIHVYRTLRGYPPHSAVWFTDSLRCCPWFPVATPADCPPDALDSGYHTERVTCYARSVTLRCPAHAVTRTVYRATDCLYLVTRLPLRLRCTHTFTYVPTCGYLPLPTVVLGLPPGALFAWMPAFAIAGLRVKRTLLPRGIPTVLPALQRTQLPRAVDSPAAQPTHPAFTTLRQVAPPDYLTHTVHTAGLLQHAFVTAPPRWLDHFLAWVATVPNTIPDLHVPAFSYGRTTGSAALTGTAMPWLPHTDHCRLR